MKTEPNMRSYIAADVRFGSKADICSAKRHVRFTPNSGHLQRTSPCPLCANSGHHAAPPKGLKLTDKKLPAH